MAAHVYNADFYDYISDGSQQSASVVAPLLLAEVEARSLLDVGAGNGAWAAEWRKAGIADLVAVDGDYVDPDRLRIPRDLFVAHDLTRPLALGRRFDIVQSLEVAEHLPEAAAEGFVRSLVDHGDVILFSAAVPHQGGEHHVNEQPPEYWRRKFAAHGYACFDWLRPRIASDARIKPWYRFNTLLYANAAGERRLSEAVRAARLADGVAAPIRGDLGWTVRRAAVAAIPKSAIHMIAIVKAKFEARLRRRRAHG